MELMSIILTLMGRIVFSGLHLMGMRKCVSFLSIEMRTLIKLIIIEKHLYIMQEKVNIEILFNISLDSRNL